MILLQNLPTMHWGNEEVSVLLAEAYRLKFAFADAPNHYKRWGFALAQSLNMTTPTDLGGATVRVMILKWNSDIFYGGGNVYSGLQLFLEFFHTSTNISTPNAMSQPDVRIMRSSNTLI